MTSAMNRIPSLFNFIFAGLIIFSCSSSAGDSSSNETVTAESDTDDGIIRLVINGNDQMSFDKEVLRAKAGATVELTLNHTGELPKEAMGHNVVILKPGTDIVTFAGEALSAASNGYIPESDLIIAHTKMLGGGESDTITFEAPEAGEYEFVCSFPGHFGLMKGKFIVE